MRYLAKPIMICSLLVLIGTTGRAQVLESIQKSFKQYNDHVLQEKMYVHTDKSFYLAGEIIWFKLYNVDAGINTPLSISKIAYVDVLDEANNPALQAKIQLVEGTGNGSFFIPVTVKNGNYKLRAYTNWMKNFGPEVFFEKALTIVNPLTEAPAVAKTSANDYDIRFFPEGGNLVAGVTSTLGFKATGTDGKGTEMIGVIVNQRNDTVVRFRSLKFGMGSFPFTPEAGGTYKAIVRIGRDNALIKEIPAIAASGYVIHVNDNDPYALKISSRGQGSGPLYLVVHSGHQVTLAQTLILDANGDATVKISKEKLGKGINHITLFNSQKQPVSERLYFNRPDLLNVLADAMLQYKPRTPVAINVSTKDKAGQPQMANMSVSVFRLDSLNNADEADIASYLWLGSEIKGEIESPSFYFTSITAETDKAADNLLLTQGWSRFKWTDAFTDKPLQKYAYLPEYNGHLVAAQLTSPTGAATRDVAVYMGVIGKKQFYGATADSTGHLLFNTKEMYGPGEIVLQTAEKDSAYHIGVINPFAEKFTSSKLAPFQLDGPLQSALENNSINMQVQNIYSSAKLKRYYAPAVDTSSFYGNYYKPYMLDAYTRFTTMEENLREYVAELTVSKQQKHFHINVISPDGYLREGDPLVLLDGVPIFDIDKVFAIDPLKIKRLDMINHVYYWGPVFADGLLSFTSYKGDMGGFELDPHAVVLDYEGMQLQREFYSPVYDTPAAQKSHLPDFRNVLYWSPDVNTDAKGNAKVSFYTSDKTGKYIAVMQGLTNGGLAGSYTVRFDVNK